ncbi:MAG: hypothetical protein H6815_03910 [Phycisphaeraceae bacterium]|nr:hypothetical protein [Phycisphaerales bacterium]MCB9859575.1 hypothetical protein [Phycisphaeraceae bacterium]
MNPALLVTIGLWVALFGLAGVVCALFLGRQPPVRQTGTPVLWCPGPSRRSLVSRIIRFGPLRPGCWYDLTEVPKDPDGFVVCPECGRELSAGNVKAFVRRKPRWRILLVCALLSVFGGVTMGAGFFRQPSWEQSTPTFVLGLIFFPQSVKSDAPSSMQKRVFAELERRADQHWSLPARLVLEPKLKYLVRTMPDLEPLDLMVSRLGTNGRFLYNDLVRRVDKDLSDPSIAFSVTMVVSRWLPAMHNPRLLDDVERWLDNAIANGAELWLVRAAGECLASMHDPRAIDILIEKRTLWSDPPLSQEWPRHIVNILMRTSSVASLDANAIEDAFDDMHFVRSSGIDADTILAIVKNGTSPEQFLDDQMEWLEQGNTEHLELVVMLYETGRLERSQVDRVITWLKFDDDRLWETAADVIEIAASKATPGDPSTHPFAKDQRQQYLAQLESVVYNTTDMDKQRRLYRTLELLDRSMMAPP